MVGSINVTSGKKTHTCLASTVCGSSRNVDYFSSRLVQDVFFFDNILTFRFPKEFPPLKFASQFFAKSLSPQ